MLTFQIKLYLIMTIESDQLSANLKKNKMDQAALVWLLKMIPKNVTPNWHFKILTKYGSIEEVTDLFSTKIKTWNLECANEVLKSERPEILKWAWYNGLKEFLPSLNDLDYIYDSADAELIPVIHDAILNIHGEEQSSRLWRSGCLCTQRRCSSDRCCLQAWCET